MVHSYDAGRYSQYNEEPLKEPESIVQEADPLSLDIPDAELIRNIDRRHKAYDTFYNGQDYQLKIRRRQNKRYLFGSQLKGKGLRYYHARYVDNIVYEAESTIKPIAMGRLPDLMVKPGNESEESKKNADSLTAIVNSDIRKRENRDVLGLASKHLPVYLIGAIKAIWDPRRGKNGNYRFKVVHPENLKFDHTSSTNNPQDMSFVSESLSTTPKEVIMMFPDKENEILMELGIDKEGEDYEKRMASNITIWETWFEWPKKVEGKWETVHGTMWKYKKVMLGKMKNPYWDHEGEKHLYELDKMGKKRELSEDEISNMLFGGQEQEVLSRKVFRNFFSDPQKPYIFLGYDQWGEQPLDETSRIEQVIPLQDQVNRRGRQISVMNDGAKGKNVFSADSGLEKKDIEDMDMNDPNEDILLEGDIRTVHTFIPGQPAPAQLYKEQEQERQKAFAKMKTHSTTRGERTTDVATTNQILRESDYGAIDDIVEETVNKAAERMAAWAMQFIKLFYTPEHMISVIGADGQTVHESMVNDLIEDGMEVIVSASGVDKLQSKREAFEMAAMKLADPLTFYKDAGMSDPRGRAEKLMTFILSPELYLQKFVLGKSTEAMAAELNQPAPGGQPPPQGQPAPQPQQPAQGGGNPMINPGAQRFDSFLSTFGTGTSRKF